jgi:hypothetical protein
MIVETDRTCQAKEPSIVQIERIVDVSIVAVAVPWRIAEVPETVVIAEVIVMKPRSDPEMDEWVIPVDHHIWRVSKARS